MGAWGLHAQGSRRQVGYACGRMAGLEPKPHLAWEPPKWYRIAVHTQCQCVCHVRHLHLLAPPTGESDPIKKDPVSDPVSARMRSLCDTD